MFHVSKRKGAFVVGCAPSGVRSCGGVKCTAPQSSSKNSAPSMSLAYISGRDVLPLEDGDGGEQQPNSVCAADAGVVHEALPRDVGLEHVAPKVHVGGEKIRAQLLEELDAPDDVEREIERERRYNGQRWRLEEDRAQKRERRDDEQSPSARQHRISETPERLIAHELARLSH